jgi:hypothetical protein
MNEDNEWPDGEEPSADTPKYQEREFLLLLVAAILYAIVTFHGDADPDTSAFVENLLLVATGGFGVSRGLAKVGSKIG